MSARDRYELALTCAALGESEAAIDLLRQAVDLKPALRRGWEALATLLRQSGDHNGAGEAARRGAEQPADTGGAARPARTLAGGKLQAALDRLDAQLRAAPGALAEALLRDRLHESPTDVAALARLAGLCMEQGRFRDAERLAARAVDLAPHFGEARHMLGVLLFRRSRVAEARGHAERLVAYAPREVAYRTLLAACCAALGDFTRAIAIYEALVANQKRSPALWLQYGHALKSAGQRDAGVHAYRMCLALARDMGEAYWSLADLKTEPFADADLHAMEALVARPALPAADRVFLHYALGRAREQACRYEESFTHYAAGAAIRHAASTYDAGETAAQVAAARQVFTTDFFAARAGWGCPDASPIFIVGLPRAGSTLIEQILSSHSAIEGTAELPEIIAIARDLGFRDRRAGAARYPQAVAALSAAEAAAYGDRYIEQTRPYRMSGRPFFIDKMPGNWEHVGLIRTILPNARIIDARRGPMAACFGAFKQLFTGLDFTYDLADLGRHYRAYESLMAWFDQALPGRIHRVAYEALVEDTEAEVRRLLDFSGVAFEPACLRFWESRRAVHTVSSEQVRQPIFRGALDQWQHYAPWLGPLRDALEG